MELILLSIIILLIIISICTYCKISHFTVKPDTGLIPSDKIIEESYNYPDCINQNKCLSSNNELKPTFNYNITDNRCIKHYTKLYHPKTELDDIINYTTTSFRKYYSSCSSTYNSMYSSVVGKYIMIYRPDNQHIKFNHISVHERDTTLPSLSSTAGTVIFTTNLYNNIYPEIALDSDSSITFENGGITGPPFSKIIITLPNDTNNIGYIKIIHANDTDANTLNGARLFILKKQDRVSAEHPYADIVFYKNIDTMIRNRTIYTYNYLNTPLPDGLTETDIKINNDWILPCTNCSSRAGKLFKYHTYTKDDTRCYVPILDTISNNDLLNDPDIDTLSTKYKSCSSIFNTHYPIPNGQLIYITKSNNTPLYISKIELYGDYNQTSYEDTLNNDICVFVKSYLTNNDLFENILDSNNSNFLSTDGISNPLILINLNNNINLSAIRINSRTDRINNLIGLKIYIINVDSTDPFNYQLMHVTGYYNVISSDIVTSPSEVTNISTYLFPLNYINNNLINTYSEIILPISVNYDINNKYLTTYKKNNIYYQIPYLNYHFLNGRSIFSKTLTDSIDTLDKINNSNPDILFNFPDQNNMVSRIIGQNTELLSPILSRYIQIIANTSLINVIENITIYDNQRNIIKSVQNPYPIYTVSHSTYTSYLTSDIAKTNEFTGNGNIIIDIETDMLISFIIIESSTYSRLNGNFLYLINNNNVKKFTYTFVNVLTNILILVIDTNNEISTPGSYILNKYDYPNCLTNELCTYVNPNSYYILQNTCFLSNPNTTTTRCDTSCMRSIQDYLMDDTLAIINNNFSTCIESTDTRSFITALLWNANNLYTILDAYDNAVPILESTIDINLSYLILNVSGNTLINANKSSTVFTETNSNVSIVNQNLLSTNYGTLFSSSGYIDFSNNPVLSIPNLFTIQFWCKFDNIPDSNDINRCIFTLGDMSNTTGLMLNKTNLRIGSTLTYNINTIFIYNTWYYIKLIRNPSNEMRLYINGTLELNIPNTTITINSTGTYRQLRLLNTMSGNLTLTSMNGYIADFKMYKSYFDPNPTVVPTRRIYDVFQGNIVSKWVSNKATIFLKSSPVTNIMSARTTLNKKSIKKIAASIIYILNGETLLNKVKTMSIFLVYSVVNPPTGLYLLLEFNFSQLTYNDRVAYIACRNSTILELSSTLSHTGTIISNYTAPTSTIDILGIQITFFSTYLSYRFINNNTSLITRNINNNATVSDLTTTLRNVYIGGMANVSTNVYFNNGIEMNIYEIFISGTVLSDNEFNNKYTELYNRWVL